MIWGSVHDTIFSSITWLPSVWSISCFSSGLLFISNLWMNSQSSAEIICPLEIKNKLFLFSKSQIPPASKWCRNFGHSPLSLGLIREPYHQTDLSSMPSSTTYSSCDLSVSELIHLQNSNNSHIVFKGLNWGWNYTIQMRWLAQCLAHSRHAITWHLLALSKAPPLFPSQAKQFTWPSNLWRLKTLYMNFYNHFLQYTLFLQHQENVIFLLSEKK